MRHVRLTIGGLAPHLAAAPSGFVPWGEVRSIELDPPTTWWPSPVLGDAIGPLVEGLLGGGTMVGADGSVAETPTFAVRLTTSEGTAYDWPATVHHLSGYRKKDADLAVRAVDHFITHPASRALLARPAELIDRLGEMQRGRPWIV